MLYRITKDNYALVATRYSIYHEKFSNPSDINTTTFFKLYNDISNKLKTTEKLFAASAINNNKSNNNQNCNNNNNSKTNNNNNSEYLLLKN